MNDERKKGFLEKTIKILALVASWIVAIVAIRGCIVNEGSVQKLSIDVESLRQEIVYKNSVIEEQKKKYAESLRKYTNEYRDLLKEASNEIDEYNKFVNDWGPREFKNRFPEEKVRRFNRVKGKLDAIVDHVRRYRRILVPFSESLNGRLNTMQSELARDNEASILRAFTALSGGVKSQIDALVLELDALHRKNEFTKWKEQG
jgi:hypothetical protein